MNWGECKLYALQKIDPTIKSLVENRNTRAYLNAIVAVANRGLQDLATAGKYIVKSFDIVQSKPKNILPSEMKIFVHEHDVSYEADGATSYYFEVSGTATIEIYVDEVLTVTVQSTERRFIQFKGLIPNLDKKRVRVLFTGLFHYLYKNVALYDANFETEADIWEYVSEKRYDLRLVLIDFYKLAATDIVFQSNDCIYSKTSDYAWEGDSVLVINGTRQGHWKVHYYAYPQEITTLTPNETELSLDPEVAALLPVYIAGELAEDDDMDNAFYFREQYEAGKQRLRPTRNIGKATFNDVNGW